MIRRIPVALLLYKHAQSGARVIRPARFENALVFVLTQDPGWISAFCDPDDDFISLRKKKVFGKTVAG